MKITFVTGNIGKWEIGRDIFAKYGLELAQAKIETPEIQSLDVTEVATYSAQYAAQKLNTPVIKSDGVGSSIDKVMILDGFTKTRGASDSKEVAEFWKKSLTLYHEMAKFLKTKG